MLVDNMSLNLAVNKGRSGSSLLKPICHEVASLTLSTGTRFVCRWIPSELNIADGPSRNKRPDGTPWQPTKQLHAAECHPIGTQVSKKDDFHNSLQPPLETVLEWGELEQTVT